MNFRLKWARDILHNVDIVETCNFTRNVFSASVVQACTPAERVETQTF
jgi:hypothetical protein